MALLGVVSVALVACGGGGDAEAAGPAASCGPLTEPQSLKLGVNPGAQDLVTFVMQEQGFAEKHNLRLEVSSFQNPAALHAAIGQQAVDVGFGGLTAMATARQQGRGTMIFDVLTGPSNVVVTRADSDAGASPTCAGASSASSAAAPAPRSRSPRSSRRGSTASTASRTTSTSSRARTPPCSACSTRATSTPLSSAPRPPCRRCSRTATGC
ncbi:hypothetical protein BJF90_04785 [Pseudonocardia sp. CNS-004]|nr:hypothetical protein BJF90_04785 [Pseudonocardia sp. CNS-004]